MDDRITEFVRGLRAAGVRTSLAEAVDAFRAVELLGIENKDLFRESLRATLIKESRDFTVFDRLFPLYFAGGMPPMENATESADLSDDDISKLKDAMGNFNERTQRLLEWLSSGNAPTKEELEQMAEQFAQQFQSGQYQVLRVNRAMMRELGLDRLEQNLMKLMEMLQEMGLSDDAIMNLLGVMQANADTLREQAAQAVGLEVAREQAERTGNGTANTENFDLRGSDTDIMERSFESLEHVDPETLKLEIRRLVRVLKSRAALRRKKGKTGQFDARRTIRANQKYGGVPVELKFRKQKIKPSIIFLVDVSGSMERIFEFLVRFMHGLDDAVSKVRIFTYYGDLTEMDREIANLVAADDVHAAMYKVREVHPYRPYNTNLGNSLVTFHEDYLSAVNQRTTVVFLGDGRNNGYDPRADLVQDLQRRAKKLIWLNPEQTQQWGYGDSDMYAYIPYCDSVHVVRNLAQLSRAIDNLLAI